MKNSHRTQLANARCHQIEPIVWKWRVLFGVSFLSLIGRHFMNRIECYKTNRAEPTSSSVLFETLPKPSDPFLFQPCTKFSLPPPLEDPNPRESWAALYDPTPENWSWTATVSGDSSVLDSDQYAGRGIYLCGYLDVPLDHTNKSDHRIIRLAVNKLQVSGLARADGRSDPSAGRKSPRTILLSPGGPGGSGTSYIWRSAASVTHRLSDGAYDVLSWDPRGVNISVPAISCFPYDATRDRWTLLMKQYREVTGSPRRHLELMDAMNDATFKGCWERYGDLPRFMSTAFLARDLEIIREALGEDELTGYLVSSGTGVGQIYANLFPDKVGRIILDGTEYVKDNRMLGGFGWTALDNGTDAWIDGFLGECIHAGPNNCALSKPINGNEVTLKSLQTRMNAMLSSLSDHPVVGYTDTSGPTLITYSSLVDALYLALYFPQSWAEFAQMLYELENGNSTLIAAYLENKVWQYDPSHPAASRLGPLTKEVMHLVVCSDSSGDELPADGLDWWESLWSNMTATSWIAGNSRFFDVFPCQRFASYWPHPAEIFRGDLNQTLKNPLLLIAETYDPATPLRNGRRLREEMGRNARLIVHHGYGHSSSDSSDCTDSIAKRYIKYGEVPEELETACYANEKPYAYTSLDK